MNKEEAAKFLKMSVRSLQRLTADGLFKPTMTGKKGAAVYDRAELEQWQSLTEDERKAAREQARGQSLSPVTVTPEQTDMTENPVTTVRGDNPARMLAAFEAMAAPVRVAEKVMLSLVEAAQLANLSRAHLRQAIEDGKLKARIIGRGWRVKRADLDLYVKNL